MKIAIQKVNSAQGGSAKDVYLIVYQHGDEPSLGDDYVLYDDSVVHCLRRLANELDEKNNEKQREY
jgi:hypothetical protein